MRVGQRAAGLPFRGSHLADLIYAASLAGFLLGIQPGQAQASPLDEPLDSENRITKATVSRTVEGVVAAYEYAIFASSSLEPDATLRVRARVVADIRQLAPTVLAILEPHLPKDNCAKYKADNWVIRGPAMTAHAKQGDLVVEVSVQAEMWQCLENPFGKDLKTRIDGPVRLGLTGRLVSESTDLRATFDPVRITVGGNLGTIAGTYLEGEATKLRQKLIERSAGWSAAALELPTLAALVARGGRFESARFIETDGILFLEARIAAKLSEADWNSLREGHLP